MVGFQIIPTLFFNIFQGSIRLYLDLKFDHEEYKIYVYTKSYFYNNLASGRLEFLSIKKGQNVKVKLALQVIVQNNKLWKYFFSNFKTSQSPEYLFTLCLTALQTAKMIRIMILTRSKN